MTEELLVGLATVIVLGIGAQWIAWRFKLPSILLLLTFGFLIGPVFGFLHVDALMGDLLFPVVSLSVGIILFEGGLSLKLVDIRQTGRVIRNLITVGALVTWLLSTAAAHFIIGLNLGLAAQLGAVLVVTGPTVIGPLLRHVRPSGQVGSILRWEGILIDPIGATLAVLVFDAILIGDVQNAAGTVVTSIVLIALFGTLMGLLCAALLVFALRRYLLPDYLQSVFTLMLVVAAFVGAELLQHEAGLLATTVMGIALANQKYVPVRHITEFKENIGVLLISSLFILLAARLQIADLQGLGWNTLLFILAMLFIVRPVSVYLSTLRSGLNWRERVFLSWMAPRGIVAAATSSIFALRLTTVDYPQADMLVPVTFAVVVSTCVVYGLTSLPLARWLKLSQANPQGVLLVGAHEWAQQIAQVLQAADQKVALLDSNFRNVQAARLAGLEAYYGSATGEPPDEMTLEGIGRVLALTSNDEVNALAAIHFIEDFGRAEVYQLPFSRKQGQVHEPLARELRGRLLFEPDATFAHLNQLFSEGATIKATPLTREFDFLAYQGRYSANALPLFLLDPATSRLIIFATDRPPVPQPGQTVISLIRANNHQPQPDDVQMVTV